MVISRVVRQAFPGRNELATAGDRLEGAVLVAAVAVALLAVPVAGAVGSELFAQLQAQAATERATNLRTEAVLAEDAPLAMEVDDRGTVLESSPVAATWSGPDGQARRGIVQAHHGAKAGATVPIWTDRQGALTEPPLSAGTAVVKSAGAAVLLWGAASVGASLLFFLTRFAHTRLRLRRWELQWEQVSRDWTAR